jgi:hypothetical protein
MRPVLLTAAGVFCIALASCTSYRIHVKVIPEDTYNVFLNDAINKGATDSAGVKDLFLEKVSVSESPKITVRNKIYSGYARLDAYEPMLSGRNVDSLSVVKGPNGERVYNIRFLVNRRSHGQEQAAPRPPVKEEKPAVQETTMAFEGDEMVEVPPPATRISSRSLHGINDNPDYARKIAATGSACFFVGMGLNYATAFIPVYNSDGSPNVGGLVASLGAGLAGSVMSIAGTSYAVGGAKLAWELGEGRCDVSKEPFTLWGPYKGGWVFVALGGAFGVISGFVPVNDMSTALTLTVITLGLQIGRDVCWSIVNIKASGMTRKVKECLEEQKTPSHHLRLELDPFVTRQGAGMRCSLLF